MDCSPPGSSVHGVFQARILEWITIFLLQAIFPEIKLVSLEFLALAGRFSSILPPGKSFKNLKCQAEAPGFCPPGDEELLKIFEHGRT